MIGQVVASGKPLAAMRALMISGAVVLGHVPLPIGFVGKLEATFVADKRLDAAMRSHVSVEQCLPQVGLLAQLTFKGSRPDATMLPLMVDKVAFGDKTGLAHVTCVRLLALMFDPHVLLDARLVEHLFANGTRRVEGALLVFRQKVDFMLKADVSSQTRSVHKDFPAVGTFLGLPIMLALFVPVQISLSLEHFPAMTKELFWRLHRPVFLMNSFVLGQVAVPFEGFPTDSAG
jgi:hypothetical protein